jgi:hypothetical protein
MIWSAESAACCSLLAYWLARWLIARPTKPQVLLPCDHARFLARLTKWEGDGSNFIGVAGFFAELMRACRETSYRIMLAVCIVTTDIDI